MPTCNIIDGVKIELFFDDHAPPHFHPFIAEYDALIEIEPSTILNRDRPRNKRNLILKWHKRIKKVWLRFGTN